MPPEIEKLICCKCNVELVIKTCEFTYMGYHFNHQLPCCPSCGQVFISEELVNERIVKVEMELEAK
jgi:hypothetical protein